MVPSPPPISLSDFVAVPRNLLSRLLYANPVCFLSVGGESDEEEKSTANNKDPSDLNPETSVPVPCGRNTMVLSWLTPVDNRGTFFLSMKRSRHTAEFLTYDRTGTEHDTIGEDTQQRHRCRRFVLSVPIKLQEELVKRIGLCSGRDPLLSCTNCSSGGSSSQGSKGKAAACGYEWCRLDNAVPPDKIKKMLQPRSTDLGVAGCCAHILCEVLERFPSTPHERHHLKLLCRIGLGLVDERYFADGKTFVAPSSAPAGEGYMSFLGSMRFVETRV